MDERQETVERMPEDLIVESFQRLLGIVNKDLTTGPQPENGARIQIKGRLLGLAGRIPEGLDESNWREIERIFGKLFRDDTVRGEFSAPQDATNAKLGKMAGAIEAAVDFVCRQREQQSSREGDKEGAAVAQQRERVQLETALRAAETVEDVIQAIFPTDRIPPINVIDRGEGWYFLELRDPQGMFVDIALTLEDLFEFQVFLAKDSKKTYPLVDPRDQRRDGFDPLELRQMMDFGNGFLNRAITATARKYAWSREQIGDMTGQ